MSTGSRYKCPSAAGNAHFQQQRSMFLPIMLCSRSSVKDVKIPHRRSDKDSDNKSAANSHKLRRFFSTKSLPTNPTANDSKGRRRSNCHGDSCKVGVGQPVKPINLSDLDPPLPVVRPPPSQQQQEGKNLWKRRSGEAALKSLQVQSSFDSLRCVEAKTV